MSPGLTIALVVPVFNEAGVVEQTHARVCAVVNRLPYEFHFYYVDDGSRDGTADSLQAISDRDPRVTILSL